MSRHSSEGINLRSPKKAGRKQWIGLAVIALPCILYSMDLSVLNLALPYISEELRPSSAELLWIVDIYGFMIAGFLITMGTLGDKIGRRKLLLIGAIAFGMASLLAAFSRNAEMLIASRAILGIAGATLAPSTLSLIRNMFNDSRQRTFAIGVWITSYSVGGALGPLIGGIVLENFWWGAVFLISVPVMILLLILGPLLLPEYKDSSTVPLDIFSATLSLVSVLSMIFGLKKMAANGLGWGPAGYIAGGILIGFFFLRRQRKMKHPLIDPKLFKTPSFNISLLVYTLGTFAAFGLFIFTFQYMQLIVGLSPLKAGLWSVPFFSAFIIGSMFTPMIVHRVPPERVIIAGLLMAAVGFGLLTGLSGPSGFILLIVGSFLYCLGLAPIFTLATDIIVGSAPPATAGSAAAISETGSEFGGALGIAIIGSMGTAIYRGHLSENIPGGVQAQTVEAAKETLSAAFAEAHRLPSEAAASLVKVASDGFIKGMEASAILCAVLMIGLAFLYLGEIRRN